MFFLSTPGVSPPLMPPPPPQIYLIHPPLPLAAFVSFWRYPPPPQSWKQFPRNWVINALQQNTEVKRARKISQWVWKCIIPTSKFQSLKSPFHSVHISHFTFCSEIILRALRSVMPLLLMMITIITKMTAPMERLVLIKRMVIVLLLLNPI